MPSDSPDRPPSTERLVTYDLDGEETVAVAIAFAFEAIGTDTHGRETTVHDRLPAEAVDTLCSRDIAFRLQFVLWEHPEVVTEETVRIHAAPGE